ncbi:MATE family efflux transporter [Gluconobacter morbifer]
MRHVITMAGTGAIGLMAVFAVDLLNYGYISHLHDPTLTAGIAFATSLSFVQVAVSIGLTIGLGACTGRLIGARDHAEARRLASAFIAIMVGVTAVLGLLTATFATPLLGLLGAQGGAQMQAATFLHIVSPALPLVCLGMALSALLRAVGDAKRSMRVTLTGAVVAACLDPIMIFGLHLGLEGAAISTVLSRCAITGSGFLNLRGHAMLQWPERSAFRPALRKIGCIALPAIATNLATPTGALFVTHAMSRFGLDAISGQATIDRIVPVAFSLVFALTGSVGPIMAQNLGARQIGRVQETLLAALKLTVLCVTVTWIILAAGHNVVLHVFPVHGVGVDVVRLFCCWLVLSYMFVGLLFVANTAFNNLGHPLYSTAFNWGRATLGTIPFVWIGSAYGPVGILVGQSLGVVLFGSLAVLTAFGVVRKLEPELLESEHSAEAEPTS